MQTLTQVPDLMPLYAVGVSFLFNAVLALLCWGFKNEVKLLRAEVKGDLAAAELRFYEKVNGNYVRTGVLTQVVTQFTGDIERLQNDVDKLNG
jgi:hypothetical protein